jgi:hypothetical protein
LQATIAAPVKGKMFKGLCICYAVIVMTFFSVGISGYWAFGNQAKGTVLANFMGNDMPLLPTWFLLITNVFTLLQISAVSVVSPTHNYIFSLTIPEDFWLLEYHYRASIFDFEYH